MEKARLLNPRSDRRFLEEMEEGGGNSSASDSVDDGAKLAGDFSSGGPTVKESAPAGAIPWLRPKRERA
jgi:hypothetical protein